jgi:hypothetical protein
MHGLQREEVEDVRLQRVVGVILHEIEEVVGAVDVVDHIY